jgi:hypothetical protein
VGPKCRRRIVDDRPRRLALTRLPNWLSSSQRHVHKHHQHQPGRQASGHLVGMGTVVDFRDDLMDNDVDHRTDRESEQRVVGGRIFW